MNDGTKKKGFQGAGEILTWASHGVYTSRGDLENNLKEAGVPVRVKKAHAATYLRRAIEAAIEDGLIRKIGEDIQRVSFAVVDEQRSLASGSWSGNMRGSVTLNKQTGEVHFGKGSEAFAEKVNAARGKAEGGLLGREVAATFAKVFKQYSDAVVLRPQGGVIFVPRKNKEVVRAVDGVVRSMKSLSGFELYRFTIHAGSRTLGDVARRYRAQVLEEFTQIQERVKAAVKEEKVTARWFKGRESEIGEMMLQIKRLEHAIDHDMQDVSLKVRMYNRFLQLKHAEYVKRK